MGPHNQKESKLFLNFSIMILFLLMSAAGSSVLAQGESYKVFYPHFIDLKGWNGDKPDGAAVDMPGMTMTSAHRSYHNGEKELEAMIMIGNPAMMGMQAGVVVETSDVKASIKEINGFKVHQSFDKGDNSGSVSVVLKESETKGAFFILTFEGMNADEGLKYAEKFDWKEMAKSIK